MSDTPTPPTGPTQEQIDAWTAVIHQIMERDGVSEIEANINLVNLLLSPEVQEEIKKLEELKKQQEELWTNVIGDLQQRFPDWSEEEANTNLANLLKWVADHPGQDFVWGQS